MPRLFRLLQVPALHRLLVAAVLLASGCAGTGVVTGSVEAHSPVLGSFRFVPDRCTWHPELRAADFTSTAQPPITVRLAASGEPSSPLQVVIAHRTAPGGPREVVLTRSTCPVLHGYTQTAAGLAARDVATAARFQCVLPDSTQVVGLLGSGGCP
jgi:hypothetical protein